jgi:uncharacterized RDD family membrane protein YckC
MSVASEQLLLPATLWRRLVARLLDAFVLSAPVILLVHLVSQSVYETRCVNVSFAIEQCAKTGSSSTFLGFTWIALFLATALYEVFFLCWLGATPGKWAMNIKVVDERTGGPLRIERALARYATLCVTGSVFTIGWWSGVFDRSGRNRGWHDFAGSSVVVRQPG